MNTRVRDNIRNLIDLTAEVPGVESPPSAPAPRPVYHSDECSCESCCDIRAAMDIYLKAKKAYTLNGF